MTLLAVNRSHTVVRCGRGVIECVPTPFPQGDVAHGTVLEDPWI
jgi:hypothetical protein